MQQLGLQLLAREHPSNALTAAILPESINGVALIETMRHKYAAFLAGGQGRLKGKIVRLAHLGLIDQFYLLEGVAALEFGLKNAGSEHQIGSGVAAAMQYLDQSAD